MYNAKTQVFKIRKQEDVLLHQKREVFIGDKEYDNYVAKLYSESDIRDAIKSNNEKFNKPIPTKQAIKKFGLVGWGIVAATSILGALSADLMAEKAENNKASEPVVWNQQKQNNNTALVSFVVLGALMGFGIGIGFSKLNMRIAREDAIKDTYNRLSLNLFNYIKENNPELKLDENMLKKYNPEMIEAISTLLISNMRPSDTERLRAIAIDVTNKIENQRIDVQEYKKIMKDASDIINNELNKNKKLHDVVVLLFEGCVPTTFFLQKRAQLNNLVK